MTDQCIGNEMHSLNESYSIMQKKLKKSMHLLKRLTKRKKVVPVSGFEPAAYTLPITATASGRCYTSRVVYPVVCYGMQLKYSLLHGLQRAVANKGKCVQ